MKKAKKHSPCKVVRKKRPGIQERIDSLTHEELATIIKHIVWLLYFDEENSIYDPDIEWDEETIDHVAEVLVEHALLPKKKNTG
ncbi:MAG: hypothetical protein C0402_05515 [Thermodesulfovibrio sp.]|nr:hypothetical protein [Thermodesulfovibrio sp.]